MKEGWAQLKEDKKDPQKEKGWDTVAAKLWWWMAE
jgi:hypothetical protein